MDADTENTEQANGRDDEDDVDGTNSSEKAEMNRQEQVTPSVLARLCLVALGPPARMVDVGELRVPSLFPCPGMCESDAWTNCPLVQHLRAGDASCALLAPSSFACAGLLVPTLPVVAYRRCG